MWNLSCQFVSLQDILKRNTYVYKGRIHLDTSEVIDVPDGKGKNQLDAHNKIWWSRYAAVAAHGTSLW
jgi:hypothetical protein